MEWTNLTKMLREERDLEIDSFIENTEAGKQLYEICYEVHELPEVSLYFDLPSRGNYLGQIFVHPVWKDTVLSKVLVLNMDVRDYSKKIIDFAVESSSEDEFRNRYKDWCTSLIYDTDLVDHIIQDL